MRIKRAINQFLKGRGKNKGKKPDERYSSFDYCYNYFYSFYKRNELKRLADKKNLQKSCLHLGFYLASWGMMRGSSFLLEKSVRYYKKLIKVIGRMNPKLWEIDVDSYDAENISLLLNCRQQIIEALDNENNPSDTLVTKIMLGVFANIPAFDTNVRKSLGFRTVNEETLKKIKEFYQKHKSALNSYIYTFDFYTAQKTDIRYTKAKLIDMFGFIDGRK